jgi:hypothetical protein
MKLSHTETDCTSPISRGSTYRKSNYLYIVIVICIEIGVFFTKLFFDFPHIIHRNPQRFRHLLAQIFGVKGETCGSGGVYANGN